MNEAILQNTEKEEALKTRVEAYWTNRSHDFAQLRKKELECDMAKRWLKEIEPNLPKGKKCRILDVGTGGGFFAVLLGKKGHQVTGIDLTPSMITEARQLALEEGTDAVFEVMDAENLDYEEETFDVVITRNLTWTLPHPETAYHEWMRVLKPGGILMNFDADYGQDTIRKHYGKEKEEKILPVTHAHNQLGKEMLAECDAIQMQMPISFQSRPAWDIQILLSEQMERVSVDTGISTRIYQEINEFYNPVPLFFICGNKKE